MFQHWDLAPAKVVDRQYNSSNAHPTNPHYKYVVELASPDGETFRAEMKDPVGGRPFKVRAPGIGEQITVKVHWKDRAVKFNTDDPALAHDPLAGAKAKKDHWKESLAATPGAEPARPASKIVISPDVNITINGKRV
jgi:hypothetical protein